MKKIVYLPLDERPCNAEFAAKLSAGNPDFVLVSPPREILGEKKKPADGAAVARFLETECKTAYALVLSADMLLYGGIVPSRLHSFTEEELANRLALLERIKELNPALKIYAFALVMRCPSYSNADEEPDYYANCGREIFLTGQAEHKRRAGLITEEEYKRQTAGYGLKTKEFLGDYLGRREINLRMLLKIAELKKNIIDFLVIPQDDSAPYGYTAMDRERVLASLGEKGIQGVCLHPGADEAGMTLLARAVNELKGVRPQVAVFYAAEQGRNVIPLYEDRELYKSVAAQIATAGCMLTESAEEAQLYLYINVPAEEMSDAGGEAGEGYKARDLEKFTEKMAEAARRGKLVLAADVAYCNGGDAEWAKLISQKISFFRLGAYAGWNTSSNTLGTTLFGGVMCLHYGFSSAHRAFIAERVYEDIGYCGFVRKKVTNTRLAPLGLDYFRTDGEKGKVAEIVKDELEKYVGEICPEVAKEYRLAECRMPWSRMFEVGITVGRRK